MSDYQLTKEGIAYWKAGHGDTKVLLIMGFGMSGLAWEDQFNELAKHCAVVCYDHLGVGKSVAITSQQISMSKMAEHASLLLKHLGWDEVHIVGVSMGGMIAQHFALDYKEKVKSLTLIATSPGGLFSLIPSTQGFKAFWQFNQAKDVDEKLFALKHLLFPPELELDITKDEYEQLVSVFGIEITLKTRFKHMISIIFHRLRGRLLKLSTIPVIIMVPEKDILINPKESYKLNNLIPGSKLIKFPDAGHGLLKQCAIDINRELLKQFNTNR